MIQEIATAVQNTPNELPTYFGSAMAIVYAQRALKSRAFYQAFVKAVPGADKWAHRLVAVVGSLAAVGLVAKFDYDPNTGGQMLLNLPPLAALAHALKDFLFTYGGQQVLYDATRKPDPVVAVVQSGGPQ